MQGSRDKTLLRLRPCRPRAGNSTSIDLPHRTVGRLEIRIGSSRLRAIVRAHVTIASSRSPCLRHVHLRDLSAFVVSTKDGDPFWIPNLQSHQETRGFHGMISAIHVVAHEQIIRVWCFASIAKQFHEVVKLPVDIPANRHWTLDRLHVGFFHQDFPRLVAQLFHFLFGERFALPKVLDLRVQVRVRIAGPCAGHLFHNLSLNLDWQASHLHAATPPLAARAPSTQQQAPPPRMSRQVVVLPCGTLRPVLSPVISPPFVHRYLTSQSSKSSARSR